MAQGVAWYARHLGVPCHVVVPDDAPQAKLEAIARLGARIVTMPFADYQAIQRSHACELMRGVLIHPFGDDAVMAGNGTIGLEILEDLPDVDAIIIPYGGGGLCCGIASAVRALRPQVKLYAAEVSTGAPLAASLAAGIPWRHRSRRASSPASAGPSSLRRCGALPAGFSTAPWWSGSPRWRRPSASCAGTPTWLRREPVPSPWPRR